MANTMSETEVITLEKELLEVDVSKLPEVIASRINDVATVNAKLEVAKKKKIEAQNNVDKAYADAERLVEKAANLGKLNPEIHKFLNFEWTSNKDRLNALELCMKELGKHGEDTADFQQTIVRVQNTLLDSQNAVMDVQKEQMHYMEHTTDALKFLYGLNAYNIASVESIVTNLQLVLSGAKRKELGEMARQQMFLVIDQLKSQENLKTRLDKNEDRIRYIENALQFHSNKEDDILKRIAAGENRHKQQDIFNEKQGKKNKEHEKAIEKGIQKDAEQDKIIRKQAEKDIEHDKAIIVSKKKDQEHDKLLEAQKKKDIEHDKAIKAVLKKNEDQDEQLHKNAEKYEAISKEVALLRNENNGLTRMILAMKKNNRRKGWIIGAKKRR